MATGCVGSALTTILLLPVIFRLFPGGDTPHAPAMARKELHSGVLSATKRIINDFAVIVTEGDGGQLRLSLTAVAFAGLGAPRNQRPDARGHQLAGQHLVVPHSSRCFSR